MNKMENIDSRRHMEHMAEMYDELLARLRLIGRIANMDTALSLWPEAPRAPSSEILVCRCGWYGTFGELDAIATKQGCCPECGSEELSWLHEMVEQLLGKA